MGRHSRRTEHLGPPDKDQSGGDRVQFTTAPLCGGGEDAKYGSRVFMRATDPAGDRTCPQCSALHFGNVLREHFPTLQIVKSSNVRDEDRTWKEYRGVHEVRVDGVLRGYVCSENGWGAGYTVHRVRNNDQRDGRIEVETYNVELPIRVYKGTIGHNNGRDVTVTRQHFGSKEHAAYAMATYTVIRALAGWREFAPAMEPAAYMAMLAEERREREAQKEARRLETIANMGEQERELTAERERVEAYVATLRALNLESDAAVEAVRFATDLAEKDLKRIDGRISQVRAVAEREREGRTI